MPHACVSVHGRGYMQETRRLPKTRKTKSNVGGLSKEKPGKVDEQERVETEKANNREWLLLNLQRF